MSRLSFSIVAKLSGEHFKRGSIMIKSQLRSMQMHSMAFVSALGVGGVGLSNFVSRMISTAKETNRAQVTLKNISGSTVEMARHQKFLIDTSKKYGTEINTLTNGFSKFSASASASNMPISDQYKIFESLSRASTAFGLSMDDQKGVFLAVTQMMGKNKVMAEELRTQLAERLPVAMKAMANAAGVDTIGALDALMKKGKLLATDVMPSFADALNEMIPDVDTNNVNKSMNDLSNTFTEITTKLGVAEKFKAVIDQTTALLSYFSKNTASLFMGIGAVIAFALTRQATKLGASLVDAYKGSVESAQRIMDHHVNATETRAKAEQTLVDASKELTDATAAHELATTKGTETDKLLSNDRLLKAKRAHTQAESRLRIAAAAEERAAVANTEANQLMAARKSGGVWKTITGTIITGLGRIKKAMVSMLKAFWPALLISGLTIGLSKLREMRKEAKRIANIVKDAQKERETPINNNEIFRINSTERLLSDKDVTKRQGARKYFNNLLGTDYTEKDSKDWHTKGVPKDLIVKINLKKAQLKAQDKVFNLEDQKQQLQDEKKKLENKEEFKEKYRHVYVDWDDNNKTAAQRIAEFNRSPNAFDAGVAKRSKQKNSDDSGNPTIAVRDFRKNAADILNFNKPILVEWRNIEQALVETEAALVAANATKVQYDGFFDRSTPEPDVEPDEEPDDKQTDLQKFEEDYIASLRELKVRLDNNIITQKDYDNELHKLIEKTHVEVEASTDPEVKTSNFRKGIKREFDTEPHGEAWDKKQEYFEQWDEYLASIMEQKKLLNAGRITQAKYNDAVNELAREAMNRLIASGVKPDDPFLMQTSSDLKNHIPQPKLEVYDNSRDYKKSEIEIESDKLNIAKANYDQIYDLAEANIGLLDRELDDAMNNVKTLEEALKVVEAKDAVRELSKELKSGMYDGIKNVVSNVDSLVSAFERVGDVLSDADATGWERIMAVWQAMTGLGDSYMQTVEFINNLSETKLKLASAETVLSAATTDASAKKVAAAATNIAADTTETTATATNAAITVAAETAKGAAAAGSSAGSIPFPANLVAIPAAIAVAMAAFAAIPRFENGGIVGGNSKAGDKILARINSGEMILNQNQQGTLYGLLNKNTGGPVQLSGEFKMRGRDLVAVIDKYNRFKSRVK